MYRIENAEKKLNMYVWWILKHLHDNAEQLPRERKADMTKNGKMKLKHSSKSSSLHDIDCFLRNIQYF